MYNISPDLLQALHVSFMRDKGTFSGVRPEDKTRAYVEHVKNSIDEYMDEFRAMMGGVGGTYALLEVKGQLEGLEDFLHKQLQTLGGVKDKLSLRIHNGEDEILNRQQAGMIISSEYGVHSKLKDIILNSLEKDDGFSIREIKDIMEPTMGKRPMPVRDIYSHFNTEPVSMVMNALANPSQPDTYIIHEPVRGNWKSAIFVERSTRLVELLQRVGDFKSSYNKGNYSFRELAMRLRNWGLPSGSKDYVPMIVDNIKLTKAGAFDRQSAESFFERIAGYNPLDDKQKTNLCTRNNGGAEYITSISGVLMIKKGYEGQFWKDMKRAGKGFDYSCSNRMISVAGRVAELEDVIEVGAVMDMLEPVIGDSGVMRDRLLEILPVELETKDVMFELLPLLERNYLFDERIRTLRSKTGLSTSQIKGRVYSNYEMKYSDVGISVIYQNQRGKILAYPVNHEGMLVDRLKSR